MTPAMAAETTYLYGNRGGDTDASQAFGLSVGSTLNFSARFNPDTLANRTQSFYNMDEISGQPVQIAVLRTGANSRRRRLPAAT